MILGSLFAGIGGFDWAAEQALGCTTAWQLDLTGADVRRRHWPGALQVEADVATVDPLDLPPIDVLCAGFACQDLSCAGKGESRGDLDAGARTGPTYRGVLRFVATIHPEIIVLENVPALLHHRERVEEDFAAYGLTWVRCGAWDAGAPHIRRRVFVVGVRGGRAGGVIDAPDVGRWTPERDARPWASAKSSDARSPGPSSGSGAREGSDGLACQVRTRATPAARDWRTGELSGRNGSEALNQQVTDYPRSPFGLRLSPAFVETLMGLPVGWTLPTGPRLDVEASPRWPRGRYPATWDRSQLWPGYDWEPARTLPDGPPCSGRPARIRALGNAVVPQQGALAIRTALAPDRRRPRCSEPRPVARA